MSPQSLSPSVHHICILHMLPNMQIEMHTVIGSEGVMLLHQQLQYMLTYIQTCKSMPRLTIAGNCVCMWLLAIVPQSLYHMPLCTCKTHASHISMLCIVPMSGNQTNVSLKPVTIMEQYTHCQPNMLYTVNSVKSDNISQNAYARLTIDVCCRAFTWYRKGQPCFPD